MATTDVLRRAAASGQNFIVTQEPLFYMPNEEPGNRAKDPVYLAKKALIDERRLVVFRLSEHWNARQPSEPVKALTAALKWTSEVPGAAQTYRIPDTTLAGLAAQIRSRLPIRGGLRMVGQPSLRVRTVYIAPGTTSLAMAVANLQRADAILERRRPVVRPEGTFADVIHGSTLCLGFAFGPAPPPPGPGGLLPAARRGRGLQAAG